MQTAISSASLYPQHLTESAVVNIAALGCRSVEVFLQTRSEYKVTYIRQLARLCRELGVEVLSLHAASSQYEPMLFYRYRRQNADGMEILNRVLEAASGLGAGCYVFHGALRVEGHENSRILEGMHWVSETAASWGVKLALENVSWCAGWSPAVFSRLNQENLPNLYYTFDTKQAERSGFAAEDYLQAMAGRLINVHVSDGRGGLPDESTDLASLVRLLKKHGYDGSVILEVYGTRVSSTAQLSRSWQIMKKHFQH